MATLTIEAAIAAGRHAIDTVGTFFVPGYFFIRTNHTAQMEFDGTGETPFDPSILSWTWEPYTNPSGYRIQRPTTLAARPTSATTALADSTSCCRRNACS